MCIGQILHGTTYSGDPDALIWQYDSKGECTTSSLFSVINFGGAQRVFLPSIWSIVVPPRIHIFLWLLANNRLVTRDNLDKRNMGKPLDCVFCFEHESIDHLFVLCV